jgi:hypothetical protein
MGMAARNSVSQRATRAGGVGGRQQHALPGAAVLSRPGEFLEGRQRLEACQPMLARDGDASQRAVLHEAGGGTMTMRSIRRMGRLKTTAGT